MHVGVCYLIIAVHSSMQAHIIYSCASADQEEPPPIQETCSSVVVENEVQMQANVSYVVTLIAKT